MIRRCRPLLGTMVEISADTDDLGAIEAAFGAIEHVQAAMSFHSGTSDLARLRAAAAGRRVAVDPETVAVLKVALDFYAASDALFEIAAGRALVHAGFLPRDGLAPLAYYCGTSADIEIVDAGHVICHRPVLIDLGGIAKGHAVDRAAEVLIAAGVNAALINAGGDLRMFGPRAWEIDLRDADDRIRQRLSAQNLALASSANLRNRRRWRGQTHTPHLGRDGAPVLCGQRVTVIAERCIIADALTKVAMADRAGAEKILRAHGGYVLQEDALAEAA